MLLMRGQTTVSGNFPDDVKSEILICRKTGIPYPYMQYDKSNGKNIEITIVFENNALNSISLIYTLHYTNSETAEISRTANMVDMNHSFGAKYGPGAFNARYVVNDTDMQTSLFATSDDLKDGGAEFFLIDNSPKNLNDYRKNYVSQGFNCAKK